jgi:hypothetical protein
MADSTTQEVDNAPYTAALNRAIRRLLVSHGVGGGAKYADQAMTEAADEIARLDGLDPQSEQYTIRMSDAMQWIGTIFSE